MRKSLPTLEKKLSIILLLIPFFYFFTGIYFRLILGNPSLRSVDPEYIYFISGLSIAENHFHLGHIDNPGAPLQYLIAIVFRIIHFFRGNGTTLVQDVFSEPDMYLSAVNCVLTAILSFMLFIGGRFTYKKTGSILYGVLLQTIPLIAAIWYQLIGRITPELLIPLPIILLSMFFIKYISDEKEEFSYADVFILSSILAFGLSIKLTMISFLIIPLILIKPWRKKIIAILLPFVLFLVMAFPVTLQLKRFWYWIRDLFLFSGQYGDGKKNIVEFDLFKQNIIQIFNFETYLSYLVLVMIIIVGFSIVWFWRKKNIQINKKLIVAIATLTTLIIQVIITGKNYQPRYFMPAVMLGPFLLYLFFEIGKEFSPHRYTKMGINVFLILFLGWFLHKQTIAIRIDSQSIAKHVKARQASWHFVESLDKNAVNIIVSQDYGSPYKEYALLFSTAWADNSLKPYYAEELGKLYPNTYQYTTWDDKFRFWAEPFDPQKIIESKTPVYMYLERKSEELYNRAISKINPQNVLNITSSEVFFNPIINEVIYKLDFTNKSVAENGHQ